MCNILYIKLPPYPQFYTPEFQLPNVICGLKIWNVKFKIQNSYILNCSQVQTSNEILSVPQYPSRIWSISTQHIHDIFAIDWPAFSGIRSTNTILQASGIHYSTEKWLQRTVTVVLTAHLCQEKDMKYFLMPRERYEAFPYTKEWKGQREVLNEREDKRGNICLTFTSSVLLLLISHKVDTMDVCT